MQKLIRSSYKLQVQPTCPSSCRRLSFPGWSWPPRLSAPLAVSSPLPFEDPWTCWRSLMEVTTRGSGHRALRHPTPTLHCCWVGRWESRFPTPPPFLICSLSHLAFGRKAVCRHHTDPIQWLTHWAQTHALQPVLPGGSRSLLSWCSFLGSLRVLPLYNTLLSLPKN